MVRASSFSGGTGSAPPVLSTDSAIPHWFQWNHIFKTTQNKLFCSFKLFFTQPFSSSQRLHEFSVQKHKCFAILILTEKKDEAYLLCLFLLINYNYTAHISRTFALSHRDAEKFWGRASRLEETELTLTVRGKTSAAHYLTTSLLNLSKAGRKKGFSRLKKVEICTYIHVKHTYIDR